MCGDSDEAQAVGDAMWARFASHARITLIQSEERRKRLKGVHTYMETLFHDVLDRCVADSEADPKAGGYQLLSAQIPVFARLTGYLAAHVSLGEDPLRKVMEALMHGYSEVEQIATDRDHHDGHGHHSH